jgi:steroid delta-isomerase-like uncharacterized protein
MSTEENKALVRRLYEEIFNEKKLTAIDDYFAPNVIDDSLPPGAPDGIEGVRQTMTMFLMAFPDLRLTIEEMIAEGDKVVTRWTFRATHQGASLGMPATGKHVTMPGMSLVRLEGGKSVENWVIYDQLSLLQQLGLAPASAQAAS